VNDRAPRPRSSADFGRACKLQEDVPQGLERGFILPLPQNVLPAEGVVGIPALAPQFRVGPAGLAIPASRPTQPLDLVGVILTLKADFGQELPLEVIDDQLRRLPLRQVLWVLAQVCQRSDRATTTDDQIVIAQNLLPSRLVEQASRLLRQPDENRVL
jgi:hypothetical protein